MNKTLIAQFSVAMAFAAGTVWLGEVWRNEGKTFVEEKEKEGGIEKTRLLQEAEKKKNTIIEGYEAEGRVMRGLIEGRAAGDAERTRGHGSRDREDTENVGTRSLAYAMETTIGMDAIADRLVASISDSAAAQTVNRYLRKGAQAQDELQKLAWAPRFDCAQGKEKAVAIASGLAQGSSRSVLDKY